MTTRRLLAALFCAIVVSGCASGGGHALAPAAGADQLRVAQLRYDRHEYTGAIELLKGYLQYQTGAGDLDQAHFLLGMCYVQDKDWPMAATEFGLVTTDFADSPRAADAHYWLALSYWKQSHPAAYDQEMTRRAIAQVDRFLALYPGHPKAAEAQQIKRDGRARLAEKAIKNGRLYLKLRQFTPARYYFAQVQKDYADTPWVEQARVGEAEALFGLGQKDAARQMLGGDDATWNDLDAKQRAAALKKRIGAAVAEPAAAAGAAG